MHDELIKAIRENEECNNCSMNGDCNERKMSLAAADAIERLMAEVDRKDKAIQGLLTQIERLQHEQQP